MKRNLDLCRILLLQKESESDKPSTEGYSGEDVLYNLQLMSEAGLIDARFGDSGRGGHVGAVFLRLRWAGHEFLDASRNDTAWNKAKEAFVEKGVQATFETMKAALELEIKRHLGLP